MQVPQCRSNEHPPSLARGIPACDKCTKRTQFARVGSAEPERQRGERLLRNPGRQLNPERPPGALPHLRGNLQNEPNFDPKEVRSIT